MLNLRKFLFLYFFIPFGGKIELKKKNQNESPSYPVFTLDSKARSLMTLSSCFKRKIFMSGKTRKRKKKKIFLRFRFGWANGWIWDLSFNNFLFSCQESVRWKWISFRRFSSDKEFLLLLPTQLSFFFPRKILHAILSEVW